MDSRYLELAKLVSSWSKCSRRKYGAVLVQNDEVISLGYNGTPRGMRNCVDGGCPRCASSALPGTELDKCLCVHAEMNAMIFAPSYKRSGAEMYISSDSPCILCCKELIQAGIVVVHSPVGSFFLPEVLVSPYSTPYYREDISKPLPLHELNLPRNEDSPSTSSGPLRVPPQ